MAVDNPDNDLIDQMIREYDETFMALPEIESEPHLLISKVRKHYMEYVIKLLSTNYETHQKLLNKNIHLPSAIWRCAKNIETNAAQACMVVQLYRRNIVAAVNELKKDTKKGKLNRRLYDCLNKPPPNDKKIQTRNDSTESSCQCGLKKRKRRITNSVSPKHVKNNSPDVVLLDSHDSNSFSMNHNIPVVNNLLTTIPKIQAQPLSNVISQTNNFSPQPVHRASVESEPDDLMMQLDKLFHGEQNDDDIFEGALCGLDTTIDDQNRNTNMAFEMNKFSSAQDTVIENHAAQIKSLDERLASLTGLLVNNDSVVNQKIDNQKSKKSGSSKWLCEEYYLKQKLFELLDQIGDSNRKNLEKIKAKFVHYFGYDSDDEGILSPLEETSEFIVSCKERIAPWVVKILTPYYIKGHIKGKGVFKSLAKHLIRLIYQCSKYPEQYEVTSFVMDFLKNHRTIRCEADFKEFRIENI